MAKYKIAIEEHLVKEVFVEAESLDEALQKAEDDYRSELIVLDVDDHTKTLIACIEPEPTEWYEL